MCFKLSPLCNVAQAVAGWITANLSPTCRGWVLNMKLLYTSEKKYYNISIILIEQMATWPIRSESRLRSDDVKRAEKGRKEEMKVQLMSSYLNANHTQAETIVDKFWS